VVVIDPGHGGHDPGAKGPGGVREKDVCLALAKAVAAELNRRPGYRAVLTRDQDVFLHLRQRTRIAAEHKADLFVSIHANASRSKSARGTEVYFLSLRGASDESASEVAMRENAADHVSGVPEESQDEIEDILVDLLRASALERSSELAVAVIEHLRADPDLDLRGVKQAGFDVLKTAGMPSILIETAFISHPKEAKLLKSRDFQRRFANMVATAVDTYLDRTLITDTPGPAGRPGPAPASARPPASTPAAGS
jgi:N-acetylmuramoyl-L-alanine amidase